MITENHRKETQVEAKVKGSEESSVPLLQGVDAIKALKGTSALPSQNNSYIAKIEIVVSDHNIGEAIKAVKRNKGAPGIDGITTEVIEVEMCKNWPRIKQAIFEGTYKPSPVKRVGIPKPDGKGIRQLGIPTVMDRIIQQALHQELTKVFDPTFSPYSYGFRPNRSAHQAILQAKSYIQEGCQ